MATRDAASGDRSLTLLMKSNWDHVTHYDMVEMIRRHGQVVPVPGCFAGRVGLGGRVVPGALPRLPRRPDGAGQRTRAGQPVGRDAGLRTRAGPRHLVAGRVARRRRRVPAHPASATAGDLAARDPRRRRVRRGTRLRWRSATPGPTSCSPPARPASRRWSQPRTFGRARLLSVLLLGGLAVATAHSWLPMAPLAGVAACVPFLRVRRVLAGTSPGQRARARHGGRGLRACSASPRCLSCSSSGASDALTLASSPPQYSMSRLLMVTLGACAAAAAAWSRHRDAGSRRALDSPPCR